MLHTVWHVAFDSKLYKPGLLSRLSCHYVIPCSTRNDLIGFRVRVRRVLLHAKSVLFMGYADHGQTLWGIQIVSTWVYQVEGVHSSSLALRRPRDIHNLRRTSAWAGGEHVDLVGSIANCSPQKEIGPLYSKWGVKSSCHKPSYAFLVWSTVCSC